MTEPNANDAGELNLEQLETVAGGALGTLQPSSLGEVSGLTYNKLTGAVTPLNANQPSQGTSAANAISLTLSGSSILSVGTITMPTAPPTTTPTIPSNLISSTLTITGDTTNGTGGFTIG